MWSFTGRFASRRLSYRGSCSAPTCPHAAPCSGNMFSEKPGQCLAPSWGRAPPSAKRRGFLLGFSLQIPDLNSEQIFQNGSFDKEIYCTKTLYHHQYDQTVYKFRCHKPFPKKPFHKPFPVVLLQIPALNFKNVCWKGFLDKETYYENDIFLSI